MAANKLETEALAIFNRYDGDLVKFMRNSTKEEWRQVLEYLRPEIEETLKICLPIIARYIFEERIYPLVLELDPKNEDRTLVDALDMTYEQLTEPNLWKEFKEELGTFTIFGGPNEKISPELTAKLQKSEARVEKLKKKIRKRLREEEAEEKRLLAEEQR